MSSSTPGPRIIVALDYPEASQALAMASRLDPWECRVKVGKELFALGGPELVRQLVNRGFDVFLDLKYHDIPHTVAQAVKAAADMGVWMLNVHALGGRSMMAAAREALVDVPQPPLLIAVTVLTSLDETELHEVGLSGSVTDIVSRLAALAQRAGMDGVVCSAREARTLRARFGPRFQLVTPGIRPGGVDLNDQKRSMTPVEAVRAGADYLVIGRPITLADDPHAALQAIAATLE